MSKARNLANLLADGAVGASELASTLDLSGKTMTLPAGVGGHASGDEASRPASPSIGTTYFNTDEDTLQQYTATGWKNIGGGVTTDSEANRPATPAVGTLFFNTDEDTLQQYTSAGWRPLLSTIPASLGSVSGSIINGFPTTLTISGLGFGTTATVKFSYGGTTETVQVTPSSSTQISVAVPSSIYDVSVGTAIAVSVLTNNQNTESASKTIITSATGGTRSIVGSDIVHVFNSSGSFTVPAGLTLSNVQYLAIAGGGGGGHGTNSPQFSGGGAGGVVFGTLNQVTSSTYTVNVGIGGTGSSSTNGGNTTVFGGYAVPAAVGGGYGGGGGGGNGGSGGSGGGQGGSGSAGTPQTRAAGTSGQGNAGGAGLHGAPDAAGGGGGYSTVGLDADGNGSGLGGLGYTSSISGNTINYAGGGGRLDRGYRGGYLGKVGGPHGDANSGSGGAGSAGNGGSGIVIIRYAIPT